MKGWLVLTASLLPLLALVAWFVASNTGDVLRTREALVAAGVGWFASSAGWFVVLRGLTLKPRAFVAFFGLGLAVKGAVLATGIAAAVLGGLARLEPLAITAVGVFVFASFVQMIPVARRALGAPGIGEESGSAAARRDVEVGDSGC